jgi:hypothetical protein
MAGPMAGAPWYSTELSPWPQAHRRRRAKIIVRFPTSHPITFNRPCLLGDQVTSRTIRKIGKADVDMKSGVLVIELAEITTRYG